jgi:hypothetical protein
MLPARIDFVEKQNIKLLWPYIEQFQLFVPGYHVLSASSSGTSCSSSSSAASSKMASDTF